MMKLQSITKLLATNKIYSPDIETYTNTIKEPKFSFNKMAFEIYKLLDKQKAMAASTIRNFYL